MGNLQPTTASGLLKAELNLMDCQLLAIARLHAVPAGNALAVDREGFAQAVTQKIDESPYITRIAADVQVLPDDAAYTIIATGPLTSPGLAHTLEQMLNHQPLYFFDAAAPIVTHESVNMDVAFLQNRYQRSMSAQGGTDEQTDEGAYINCPLDKAQYQTLREAILGAEKIPLKDFETGDTRFFESCLPIEVLAVRGEDTMRYGPFKPVGIIDPKTGKRPYAVVQLRRDNREGTLYNLVGFQTNMRWSDQKKAIQHIPGLADADIVRYGVMHRNTFLNSPHVLLPTMQLREHPRVLVAGQLTGVEGYTESIASGLMAAWTVSRLLSGQSPRALPLDTMMGALFAYITRPDVVNFQPINSNWGIMPPLETPIRDKVERHTAMAQRSLDTIKGWDGMGGIKPSLEGLMPGQADVSPVPQNEYSGLSGSRS
jgi:methylenetetrahydrofolate--tRNA-(uracil-5-)-methyltransferase